MKKIIFAIIFVVVTIQVTNAIAKSDTSEELVAMAELINEFDLSVDSWTVTYKENIPEQSLNGIIDKMKEKGQVIKTETEDATKYNVQHTHKNEKLNESYNVVYAKHLNQIELTITIEGESWDSQVESQYRNIEAKLLKEMLTNSVQKFACMTTHSNDIIADDKIVKYLEKKLKLRQKSTQNEKITKNVNKKIVYGYIPMWTTKIEMLGNPVNMQLAFTNDMHKGTTMIIGTPILINEY